MPVILEGHNPQISKDWNGDGEIRIAFLNRGPSKQTTADPGDIPGPQMAMDSPEYAAWHRENCVLPSLLAHQAKKPKSPIDK